MPRRLHRSGTTDNTGTEKDTDDDSSRGKTRSNPLPTPTPHVSATNGRQSLHRRVRLIGCEVVKSRTQRKLVIDQRHVTRLPTAVQRHNQPAHRPRVTSRGPCSPGS